MRYGMFEITNMTNMTEDFIFLFWVSIVIGCVWLIILNINISRRLRKSMRELDAEVLVIIRNEQMEKKE